MGFEREPTGYRKTLLSDLQGANIKSAPSLRELFEGSDLFVHLSLRVKLYR